MATTRLAALDVARGLMLVVSLAVSAWITAPAWFGHAVWTEVHPVDLVFPTFVTLSGAGLGILYARGVRPLREVRRAVTLFVVGLVYTAALQVMASGRLDPGSMRWAGVLQLYAAIVVVLALVSPVVRRWWVWLIVAAATATAQLGLFAASSCSGGPTPDCNPSRSIDLAVLGAHAYAGGRLGHDPEGLVSILGAVTTAAVGAAAGRLIRERRDVRGLATGGAVVGVACAAVWLASNQVVPMFKRLWTVPFAVAVAGVVAVILVALTMVLDLHRAGRAETVVRYPLIALGRNSLLVYFGSHMLMEFLALRGPGGPVAVTRGPSWAQAGMERLGSMVGDADAARPWCLAAVPAWTALAVVLHRMRIYVKA